MQGKYKVKKKVVKYKTGVGKIKNPNNVLPESTAVKTTDIPKKLAVSPEIADTNLVTDNLTRRHNTRERVKEVEPIRNVLDKVDKVASYGQLGNFSPEPIGQGIGKVSSAIGVGTGLAQTGLDLYAKDYEAAGRDALGTGLSWAVGKVGGQKVSKIDKRFQVGDILDGGHFGGNIVRYTNPKLNKHLVGAALGEIGLNHYDDMKKVIKGKESDPTAYLKVKPQPKPYSKGTKKINKYAEGVNGVDDEEQEDDSKLNSQAGQYASGIVGGLGSLAIEGATKSNYDPKYTSQLKDENQALGRGIGGVVGQGLNLVAPGLGTLATPLLSSVGGAIQRGFQADKLKKLKEAGEYSDKIAKANENITTDLTAFQAKQYSKGGKVKTKVIEIEGKETPEIHTDKDFNLKNLGTTPHSKGGNKVVAEEGDVVFPTQNSPKKYKEIINAVMTKDKYKLKKEQAKLPEDKSSKYPEGAKKINTTKVPKLLRNGGLGKTSVELNGKTYSGLGNKVDQKKNYDPNYVKNTWADAKSGKLQIMNDGSYPTSYVRGNGGKGAAVAFSEKDLPQAPQEEAKSTLSQAQIDGRAAEDSYKFPAKPADATDTTKHQGNQFKSKYNPLELASTAYNLGTGLFGNTEKVNRKEYNPELERYVDTSENVRREINQGYKTNVANARNLSAGNANNFRSNAQAAANNKIGQVNTVDSQEYGKQLDVNNRNVGRINEGKKINIDLFNKYEDLDAQNRAVKSDALALGLEGLSDIGTRSNLNNNALQAKLIEADAYKAGRAYGGTPTTDGTQISNLNYDYNGNGAGFGVNLNTNKKTKRANSNTSSYINAKGNKSVKISRSYKIKK